MIDPKDRPKDSASNDAAEFDLSRIDYNDLHDRVVRSLIFHLLYAMESFEYQASLESVVENFNRGYELSISMNSELVRVARAVIDERVALDEKIKPLLHNWRFDRLGVITKLILRFALWELDTLETPSSVAMNEAIELAKCFAEKDAYKFVNGLLDEHVKKNNKA